MVSQFSDPLELQKISQILQSTPESIDSLTDQERQILVQLGAVTLLGQSTSSEAVALLTQLVSKHENQAVRFHANQVISRLAHEGFAEAIDALYILALEYDIDSARQQIIAAKLEPSNPALLILLQGLVALETNSPIRNDDLLPFTRAFLKMGGVEFQNRLLGLARGTRLRNWAALIEILRRGNEASYAEIVALFPSLSEYERAIALQFLEEAAPTSSPARVCICRLYLDHEYRPARDLAITQNFAPEEPNQKALFYFLTEQWDLYVQADSTYSSLVHVYETGNRTLRRRILSISRQSGQIEWLREISHTADIRWLGDLTDADWELTIERLKLSGRHDELWRLALSAPAVWSVRILTHLETAQWKPSNINEQAQFLSLAQKAQECNRHKLELLPSKAFHALTGDLTCLAINERANLLAAGSTGQAIYLWQLPEGDLRLPAFMGPATTTRALFFSPDNEYIASASGDQRIRIIRIANNQIIKTIEGHKGLVRALAIHPGGRVMVSAGFDGAIRFWRFPHGAEIKAISSPIKEVFCLALLHREDLVASAGAGAEISIWKIPEGTLQRQLFSPATGITHLAASTTSDLLAAVSRNRSLIIWNTSSGQIIRQWNDLAGSISGLCFHSDDQVVISAGSDGWITLWSISTGRVITRLKDPTNQPITALCVSPDGEWLVSANTLGRLHLWNLSTFLWLRRINQPGNRLELTRVKERLDQPSLSPAERPWLAFLMESLKWSQRFDIELSDYVTIPVGEFDIEL